MIDMSVCCRPTGSAKEPTAASHQLAHTSPLDGVCMCSRALFPSSCGLCAAVHLSDSHHSPRFTMMVHGARMPCPLPIGLPVVVRLASLTYKIDHRMPASTDDDVVTGVVTQSTHEMVSILFETIRATFSWREAVRAWVTHGVPTPPLEFYASADGVPIHHLCLE